MSPGVQSPAIALLHCQNEWVLRVPYWVTEGVGARLDEYDVLLPASPLSGGISYPGQNIPITHVEID